MQQQTLTVCAAAALPCPQVAAIGSAMVKVGLEPHARVGVYGANSPQWMIAMQVRLAAHWLHGSPHAQLHGAGG